MAYTKLIVTALLVPLMLIPTFYLGLLLYGVWHDEWSGYNASWYVSDGVCNIAVVPIDGEITTFPYSLGTDPDTGELIWTTNAHDVLSVLDRAEHYDPYIKGALMLIDSTGGSPAGSLEITDALKTSTMPIAAYVLDYAASGGYLIASGADRIIANKFSDVGSIGITMSYLDYSQQNVDQGLAYVELTSGKFKDSGSPDKPLTDEERALFERDLAVHHETLVHTIAENRNLSIEEVKVLADGSTLPASLALQKRLIDDIGNLETARAWFAQELGLAPEDVIFCQ